MATTKPYLYGNHVHGQYEYANHGVWSPVATSYLYQWYLGTTKISGATAQLGQHTEEVRREAEQLLASPTSPPG